MTVEQSLVMIYICSEGVGIAQKESYPVYKKYKSTRKNTH